MTTTRTVTDQVARPGNHVLLRVGDGLAVITINRPSARNAINPEVAVGISDAIEAAEADPEVRAMILTGAPPSFSAGADLNAIGEGRSAELETADGGFAGIVRRDRAKPLIAAVEGAALAGGTEIVCACDLVVAAEDARFGIPEVKRGLIPGAGALFRLARKLPLNLAMEAAMTGDPIDAATAHRHGFVNILAPSGGALAAAEELAARIAVNAPLALRESRRIVADYAFADEVDGWRETDQAYALAVNSADAAEGIKAFTEKRPPRWRGR